MKQWIHKIKNRYVVFFHDAVMVIMAWFGAYWLRFNLDVIPPAILAKAWQVLPLLFILQLPILYGYGLYRGAWRYASMRDLQRILKSVVTGAIVAGIAISSLFGWQDLPRAVLPLYGLLLTALLTFPRFCYRWMKDNKLDATSGKRVLIMGAGEAGESLARDLLRHPMSYHPVAFLDDKSRKQGQEIHGIRVMGALSELPHWVEQLAIDLILIAIPSANSAKMRRIAALCEQTGVTCYTLPGLSALTRGQVSVDALREISLEDLLGRDEVNLDWKTIQPHFKDEVTAVTGGGGSIGSKLCRQLLSLSPKALIIIDNNEFNLHQMEQECQHQTIPVYYYLDSVNDRVGLRAIFQRHRPGIVFHAAAFKHVPILERQPRLAVTNNVIGTEICATEAVAAGVRKFILISTDKAVCPSSYMGASKCIAELICQQVNQESSTDFITVRFGNVLGSTGSVVPLFKKQIESGGPVTVTDPAVERYFMTIPEACRLILQATTMGHAGDIYVLDMGEPVKIRYLAEQLIKLSGKTKEIQIVYTGLRAGEKLKETLFYDNEVLSETAHSKIMKAKPILVDGAALKASLEALSTACVSEDDTGVQQIMQQIVMMKSDKQVAYTSS